jgi:hypothetical protein
MSEEVTQESAIVIEGEEQVRMASRLALRGALKLEAMTSMRMSRGRSALAIVNELLGTRYRTALVAYPAMDTWITDRLGPDFASPLIVRTPRPATSGRPEQEK